MKKAFTLIELLIVISIIGVLMGVLLTQFGGATESARAAVCLSNLRNLAQACQSTAMSSGRYPLASTVEYVTYDSTDDKTKYGLVRGWIGRPHDHENTKELQNSHIQDRMVGCYAEANGNENDAYLAISNGTVFASLSYDASGYVCPCHARATPVRTKRLTPNWSYAMNSAFVYDYSYGEEATGSKTSGKVYGTLGRADRTLLFAEIPYNTKQQAHFDKSDDALVDSVLQFDDGTWDGVPESIGFNHESGKLMLAHVVFADCHTAKMTMPKSATDSDLQQLTKWLCEGKDVVLVSGRYEKVNESLNNESSN